MEEKVRRYEAFLNDRLKKDLQKVLKSREELYADVSEYLQLKTVIEQIKVAELPKGELRTQVDLGCNFYVQAKVSDVKHVFVHVGFGFFVEFTLDEALAFIEKKVAQLRERGEMLCKESAEIKSHIRLVIEGLRELQFGTATEWIQSTLWIWWISPTTTTEAQSEKSNMIHIGDSFSSCLECRMTRDNAGITVTRKSWTHGRSKSTSVLQAMRRSLKLIAHTFTFWLTKINRTRNAYIAILRSQAEQFYLQNTSVLTKNNFAVLKRIVFFTNEYSIE